MKGTSYGVAIREGFEWLLQNRPEVFTIGQGLWSPWYVGSSMTGLDKQFGRDRVIDSPVSELGTTGVAVGASMCGYRPIVVHPRIDFMLLAVDQIVTQAAKWRSMFGGEAQAPVTIRGIINRGGEQGAQHSQSLHSWFAHIPGLRVVMPATPADARDLLIASVISDDPVLYIDDRCLYDLQEELGPVGDPLPLEDQDPLIRRKGSDITLVGVGHTTQLCLEAAACLTKESISAEVVDLRAVNPLDCSVVVASVRKTGALVVADGDWSCCGLAGEVIAQVAEALSPDGPVRFGRVTLPTAPAPTSRSLEDSFFLTKEKISRAAHGVLR